MHGCMHALSAAHTVTCDWLALWQWYNSSETVQSFNRRFEGRESQAKNSDQLQENCSGRFFKLKHVIPTNAKKQKNSSAGARYDRLTCCYVLAKILHFNSSQCLQCFHKMQLYVLELFQYAHLVIHIWALFVWYFWCKNV